MCRELMQYKDRTTPESKLRSGLTKGLNFRYCDCILVYDRHSEAMTIGLRRFFSARVENNVKMKANSRKVWIGKKKVKQLISKLDTC